jgi:hypothetical protein
MRLFFLTIIFCFAGLEAWSQATSTITGHIKSSANEDLKYATVILFVKAADEPLKIDLSNQDGKFSFTGIPTGVYHLQIQSVGYKTQTIDTISIKYENQVIEKDIILETDIKVLNEVVVQASPAKKLIESVPGGYVYNVNQKKNTSQNIKELLSRVPGVYVGSSGIKIQGNSSITVLMDGKNVQLTGTELIDYLKSLPAANVGSVGIITAPSAKYDAQGTGGVLEIKSIAPKTEGFLNRITLSGSTHDKYSALFSSTFNKSSLSAFLNLRYAHTNLYSKDSSYSTNHAANGSVSSVIDQHSTTDNTPGHGFLVNTGLSWNFSKADNISLNLQFNKYEGSSLTAINTIYDQNTESDMQKVSTSSQSNYDSHNERFSAGYVHKFKKPGHQLSIDFNGFLQTRNLHNNAESNITTDTGSYNSLVNTNSVVQNHIYTSTLDYALPLSSISVLSAGVKSNIVNRTTGFNYLNAGQSNFSNLSYDERVSAAYAIYKINLKSVTVTTGLRAEQTDVKVLFDPMAANNNKQSYFNLFPNIGINKQLTTDQSLYFSYSRRIDRPKFSSYSSVVDLSNPITTRVNNPYLTPVFFNSLDLTYSKQSGMENYTSINISHKFIKNAFDNYTIYDPARAKYIDTIINYKGGSISSLNLTNSTLLFKGTSISNSLTVRYIHISNGSVPVVSTLKRSAFTCFYSFALNSDISKTLFTTLTGNYSSSQIGIQSKNRGVGSLDFSITKLLFDQNLNISCELTDILNTNRASSQLFNPLFTSNSYSKEETRILTINVGYRIGKNYKTKARRYQVTNDSRIDEK